MGPEASQPTLDLRSLRAGVLALGIRWLRLWRERVRPKSSAGGPGEGRALTAPHPWPSLTALLQVSGHLDYAKQMDIILKTVGIHTKPGWDEKGLLLAPGSLPQEEPPQAAATSSSDKTTPGDNPKGATPADPSRAQVPTGLDQSEGASLPATASPAESPQICSHGMGPNPLGCPDCASKTQGPCPGLD